MWEFQVIPAKAVADGAKESRNKEIVETWVTPRRAVFSEKQRRTNCVLPSAVLRGCAGDPLRLRQRVLRESAQVQSGEPFRVGQELPGTDCDASPAPWLVPCGLVVKNLLRVVFVCHDTYSIFWSRWNCSAESRNASPAV